MSRIGRLPIPLPSGVEVTQEGVDACASRARSARSSATIHPEMHDRARATASCASCGPSDEPRHRALHGLTRTLVNNMVIGVTTGFTQGPRDQRRRLPRPAAGHEARPGARLLAPGRGRPARRASASRSRRRPAWPWSAPTRSWSARSPPTSARVRKPEPYKGKGIRYAGEQILRKAGKAGKVGAGKYMIKKTFARRAASQAPRAHSAPHRRQRRAAAAVDLPQRQVHLRPGDRRQQRAHAGRRLEPRGELRGGAGQGRRRARRWASTVAERAKAAGVSAVVLDRGGYRYHGRVRSLAEGAREGGLDL